ncbi:hypothetical protein CPLU01_07754 [Colletotrichum plurivorum]|uniref:Uncharacterized protein n=1 Tax=Colletotrichum plurivorum TaxID=2175906 RepID=A0A8H6KFK0_9PEZI|nr:hypothetical protein CPLU01_07754 [Colletotrichum plurivorum]
MRLDGTPRPYDDAGGDVQQTGDQWDTIRPVSLAWTRQPIVEDLRGGQRVDEDASRAQLAPREHGILIKASGSRR